MGETHIFPYSLRYTHDLRRATLLHDCMIVLDLTVSQLTVTLLLFVFLEYSYIIMYEYASIIHNLSIYYVNYNDTCFL